MLNPTCCFAYGDYTEDGNTSTHVSVYRIPLSEGETFLQVVKKEESNGTTELVQCSSILYPLSSQFHVAKTPNGRTLELYAGSIRCLSEEETDRIRELYNSVIFLQNFSSVNTLN